MRRSALATMTACLSWHGSAACQQQASETGTLVPGKSTSALVQKGGLIRASRDNEDSERSGFTQALVSARIMADCTTRKRSSEVKSFLEAPVGAVTVAMERLKHIQSSCLTRAISGETSVEMRFGYRTYYDMYAESYLRRFGAPQLEIVPVAAVIASPEYEKSTPLTRIATCLAYTQPARTKAVVLTVPASVQEQEAFRSLAPFISACVDRATTLTINKVALRLRMASAIYLRGIVYPVEQVAESGSDRK